MAQVFEVVEGLAKLVILIMLTCIQLPVISAYLVFKK